MNKKIKEWKAKLSEEDPLYSQKVDKITEVIELLYPDELLPAIIKATTENELYSVMYKTRHAKDIKIIKENRKRGNGYAFA